MPFATRLSYQPILGVGYTYTIFKYFFSKTQSSTNMLQALCNFVLIMTSRLNIKLSTFRLILYTVDIDVMFIIILACRPSQ